MNYDEHLSAKWLNQVFSPLTAVAVVADTPQNITFAANVRIMFQSSEDIYVQDFKDAAAADASTIANTGTVFQGGWMKHGIECGPSGTGGVIRIMNVLSIAGAFRYRVMP